VTIPIGIDNDEVAAVAQFVQQRHLSHRFAIHHHPMKGEDDGQGRSLLLRRLLVVSRWQIDGKLADLAVVK